MRWTWLLPLLCASSVAAQTTSTLSPPVVLKPRPQGTLPYIRILEPQTTPGAKTVTEAGYITVTATASDESGIRAARIGGHAVAIGPDGRFSLQTSLHNGLNPIEIAVEDSSGNTSALTLQVWSDKSAPSIQISEPTIDSGGTSMSYTGESVTLRGRVSDESGIEKLLVNDRPVNFLPDSSFTCVTPLQNGENKIRIVALDNSGRSAERVITLEQKRGDTPPRFLAGRTYAVIIGIDKYSGRWQRLKNAVRDARAVEEALRSGFHVDRIITLYDEEATRDRIIPLFEALYDSLLPQDNLLVYYSGHGVMDRRTNKGYWVPVDAVDRSISRYVSNNDLQNLLGNLPARHVLIVADACFAGDIFRGETASIPWENTIRYYNEVAQRRSRKALTSGDEEPVLDGGKDGHSIFAYYFLQALDQINANYFDASMIYDKLRIPVGNNSNQVPQFQAIKGIGDEGGQFIFVRKR
jgi:hypothetical protein